MAKKKFIDKKKAATFRLVFKDSVTDLQTESSSDRVFTRVDGGSSFIPGFSEDDPCFLGSPSHLDAGSIFADAEDDDSDCSGEDLELPRPLPVLHQSKDRQARGGGVLPEHLRRELIELGFPDDGYNYMQHLREVGPSGSSGSFFSNRNARLDLLRTDVKAYDASRVQVCPPVEGDNNDALLVSSSSSRMPGRPSTQRALDPEVSAMLERSDGSVFDSADELDDDFILKANESYDEKNSAPVHVSQNTSKALLHHVENSLNCDNQSYDESEAGIEACEDEDRPARLLDEQFELLALREYDDNLIGELDEDDPTARGHADLSEFSGIMSDYLLNGSNFHDKYQTPADSERKHTLKNFVSCSVVQDNGFEKVEAVTDHVPAIKDSGMLFIDKPLKSFTLHDLHMKSDVSEEENEIILFEDDRDDEEAKWDCETVVTTYSNLDNHPAKIGAPLKEGKQNMNKVLKQPEANSSVIRLRGKQQLPVDFLPGRGNITKPGKAQVVNTKEDIQIGQTTNLKGVVQHKGETQEERKARKAAVKQERREARRGKKELKLLYRGESQRAQHGAAFTGPSTIHL